MATSPIHVVQLGKHTIHVKRDDLLHPRYSGNKYRKMKSLLTYLDKTPNRPFKKIVSCGCINAMLALSRLGKDYNIPFRYYAKKKLKVPMGNYLEALENGMHVEFMKKQGQKPHEYYDEKEAEAKSDPTALVIPRGIGSAWAYMGVSELAQEMLSYMYQNGFPSRSVKIFVPCGTGATSMILNGCMRRELARLHLPFDRVEVISLTSEEIIPAVKEVKDSFDDVLNTFGYEDYYFDAKTFANSFLAEPTYLKKPEGWALGIMTPEMQNLYELLKNKKGIEFDLVYGIPLWMVMLSRLESLSDSLVMYVHTGGADGNATMLRIYHERAVTGDQAATIDAARLLKKEAKYSRKRFIP